MIRDRLARHAAALPPATAVGRDIVRVGVVVALIAGSVQATIQLVNGLAFDSRFDTLNPDRDFTIFSWASSSATIVGAGALLLLGTVDRQRATRAWLLAGVFVYLSVDDALAYHELVSRKVFVAQLGLDDNLGARLFPALFAPILLAGLYLLLDLARRSARPTALAVVGGLLCLGTAIAAELLSGVLNTLDVIEFEKPPEVLLSTFEETLELGGWVLIAAGLFAEAARAIERNAGVGR